MIRCAVFVPAVAPRTTFQSPAKFWEILVEYLKRFHMLCRPGESIRPGSLWKALRSVPWVRYWRPPVTGRQVTVFLLWSLCLCRESWIMTVHRWCWIPTRVCAVTAPFHSLYYMNWIESHSRVNEGVTVGSCRINRLLFADDLVLLASSDHFSACTRSVFCCVRPNRNENQH